MCVYSNCRNEFLVIINGYVEFNPTVRGLKRRLRAWREGNLNELVLEGRTIQHRLPRLPSYSTPKQPKARKFANLMHAGKCKAALDLLTSNSEGGLLHLTSQVDPTNPDSLTVRETLVHKHTEGQCPHPTCILPSPPYLLYLMHWMVTQHALPPCILQDLRGPPAWMHMNCLDCVHHGSKKVMH